MDPRRPNPDELLSQVQADENRNRRGSLKIYFGYAAGVGKTYTMLEQARRAQAQGREVVLGYIEPHARPETQALTQGLEKLTVQNLSYRGMTLTEFDVDAALERHPDLLLVDELAHSNVEGSRHAKRWQDIEELINAGINIWTTLNVQHIESLNDVIGQVTGIAVRETVPDRIFEAADELELIDLTPDELLTRLQSGKVYFPEQAQRALQSFFQKSNLAALRELALRQAAQRIHTDVESARRQRASTSTWATAERLLVCIGPSPTTARVIRTAKRMATALHAPWLAVAIDLAGQPQSISARSQIAEHFQLAERLGAEIATISGSDVPTTVLEYARSRNVTKIFIGKTNRSWWKRLVQGTIVDRILEKSGDIDVYVIHGHGEPTPAAVPNRAARQLSYGDLIKAGSILIGVSLVATALRQLHLADAEANTVMLFLAAVAYIAFRFGNLLGVASSILAVLVFDFFFVPPFHTFAVNDAQYVVTFAVMLAIATLISALTSRLKQQVESTQLRERRTSALYQMGKLLSSLYGTMFLVSAAGEKIAEMIGGEVAIYLRDSGQAPQLMHGIQTTIAADKLSSAVASWVIDNEQIAGAGTDTLPNSPALFLPLHGSQQVLGALAVKTADMPRLLEPEQRQLLEACCNQLALALERDRMAIDAAEARIQAESEQVRSTLLSSVSHDLKTPLAAIAGASSSLLQTSAMDEPTRRQLLETVSSEAQRLNRLLENILQMSRLDAGAVQPNRQWHVLEEIVGSALHRLRSQLEHRQIAISISNDIPLIWADGLLIEQLLVNLLENAINYTPAGTPVSITAAVDGGTLRLSVADEGPGLPAGAEERIFDKFYRGTQGFDSGRGSGLGLAICRAIVTIHGGTIQGANRPMGGAEFIVRLPLAPGSPHVDVNSSL
ncbi:MAG: sensor histidine kinase KdpD [Pirellulales bacterium]